MSRHGKLELEVQEVFSSELPMEGPMREHPMREQKILEGNR